MNSLYLISFNHRSVDINHIGRFHLEDERRDAVLSQIKEECGIQELMYLSTCNRVEFTLVYEGYPDEVFLSRFFEIFFEGNNDEINFALDNHSLYHGDAALRHLFEVASSLDSLVVGEREIITQVRNAFERSAAAGLTGDTIRVVVKKTIETAKAVYTETDIARNPISVVSLAYRKLRALNVPLDASFIIVGSGVTNTAMARYLRKHGFTNFVVFNRTVANAASLAQEINAPYFALNELAQYDKGFDVIVTCTGAKGIVITKELYRTLVGEDKNRKVVIDLAIPNDLDPEIISEWDINVIAVNNLQEVAKENLKEREKSLEACRNIIENNILDFRQLYRQRQVELAMQEVPKKVKEIRETAYGAVFAKEIEQMDPASREILDKVMNYVEKKYISVPMKMAREILVGDAQKN
jgi:glutamyl-tRNA reductase